MKYANAIDFERSNFSVVLSDNYNGAFSAVKLPVKQKRIAPERTTRFYILLL